MTGPYHWHVIDRADGRRVISIYREGQRDFVSVAYDDLESGRRLTVEAELLCNGLNAGLITVEAAVDLLGFVR